MRRPTPMAEQLAWWRGALAGDGRRFDDLPRCGWFRQRKEARSKTWLPARVWLHQPIDWTTGELTGPEEWRLEVAGRIWTAQMEIAHRCLFLKPVTVDEWKWLSARLSLHGMRVGR